MKVLYIVGSCLTKNTSANMSHNAYVQGLLGHGCSVDIIMANDSWGKDDKALPKWTEARYYEYNSVTWADKLRLKVRGNNTEPGQSNNDVDNISEQRKRWNFKRLIRSFLKKIFYSIFPVDPLYPLEKEWLKQAERFKSDIEYDLVISNSSPAASHKLVVNLRNNQRIRFKRWIQIWEDPWYYDLYGGYTDAIKEEEHFLLREASEIFYVSPLTMEYQKQYYSDCVHKMKCIPLPFLKFSDEIDNVITDEMSFGYFGDYYSQTRNLVPFYEALCETKAKGYIYGDSNLVLEKTEEIEVSGRVTLDVLSEIQNKTSVLVHLCNLKGGQIPGKIYHYSATNKAILFILDGTEKEKIIIKEFFGKFNRYYFCENNKKAIMQAIKELEAICDKYVGNVVNEFEPKNVVSKFLN